jgi:hypothetical protein
MVVPLILTTFEGKPVTYKLNRPIDTFGSYAIFSLITAAALMIYLKFRPFKNLQVGIKSRLANNLKAFAAPESLQVWIIGYTGFVALGYTFLIVPRLGMASTSTAGKFIEGFGPYAYMPAILMFPKLIGRRFREMRNVRQQLFLPLTPLRCLCSR